jgi:hypothetical protein
MIPGFRQFAATPDAMASSRGRTLMASPFGASPAVTCPPTHCQQVASGQSRTRPARTNPLGSIGTEEVEGLVNPFVEFARKKSCHELVMGHKYSNTPRQGAQPWNVCYRGNYREVLRPNSSLLTLKDMRPLGASSNSGSTAFTTSCKRARTRGSVQHLVPRFYGDAHSLRCGHQGHEAHGVPPVARTSGGRRCRRRPRRSLAGGSYRAPDCRGLVERLL